MSSNISKRAMSKRNKIITNNNSNRKVPNEAMEDGIYRNARAAHVAASLIGCPVQVRVKNGTMYDGILTTISPEMTIVLEMAHKSNENGSNVCLPLTKDTVIIDTIVINWPDVVSMTALNVDLSFASKESFATDTAISGRSNGQAPKTRDLQPFECDGPAVGGLEDGENGWSPDDMFQTNESKFTIQSSFNQDLSQYTTPLPNVNSADYREKNERAERLAMEIEGGDTHRSRAQLENGGEDEEMAFSAVHRNQRPRNNHQNSNNPQWRRGAGTANVNGGSRMGNQGGANVSGIGRGGGGPGSAPVPRQTFPPVQQGGQAPPPRSAASSSQPPFPSAHQIPQSQISPKPSGFGLQQDRSPDNRAHSQQQQERNLPPNARPSTEYNRQSSSGSEGRNLAPSSSNGKPEVKVTAPPAGIAASADGRSPQSSSAKDTKKPGGMPSPVDQLSGGVDRTPKQAPWGGNQKQSQPMPPRSEPLPPRSQVALPVTSAPRTQPLEQKLPQQKNDEAKKIESLQEFGKSLNIQYDSNQSKDAKTSPRPSQQPVAGHSPSRAESEGAGHDGQSLTQKSTSAEQATIAKQPSEQSLTPKSGDTDKALVGENDGDSADKQQSITKTSTLNPNAKEFTLNPNAKEFNPTKMFQPVKPVTSPTPPRVIPGVAPPAAAPAPAPMMVPTGYISVQPYPLGPVMLPGAPQMRPMPGNNKRATVSVSGRVDQAQAATGQPLIAPQAPPYNIISLMPQSAMPQVIPTHLLDPSQISAQQPSGQQPIPLTTMIVSQPGVPMTQHIVGGQTQVAANPQMNPPPPPGAGGQQGGAHPSSSPVHQQQPQQTGPMQPPQTPTSGTPQPTQPPPQIYYSQQPGQGPQQMMATVQGTPPSPQQQHVVFPPQHFTTLQHQLGHMGAGTAYQFTPGGPQQFQPMPLHMAGTPGAGAPHGVVRMAGLQHPHMTQPTHVIMQQPAPGQLHPAQMQSMMGQGALAHPGIPGGLPTQPTQLANIGPQGFVASQPMGNIYYPVPYIAQPGSFHPAGHAIPSSMQFQPTQ